MPQEKLPTERRGRERRSVAPPRTHHRRHGYRGYGSGFGRGTDSYGGAVHWGRGFGGVSFPVMSGGLPDVGIFSAEVWERGPYGGLPPKGYSRSDDRIREDVCDELTRRPDVDPRRVTVAVRDGEVTLEGAVENLRARHLADEIATNCAGVKQVHNRLRIEKGNGGSPAKNVAGG